MNKNINQPRRTDRQINDEQWIKDFLQRAPYAVLGTSYEDQPFLNPNLFVYDQTSNAIYVHTAARGRTPDNISVNGRVCLVASEMGRLLPAGEAPKFSVEYASVIIFGRAQILHVETEMIHGLQLLMDKYFPHHHPGKDYPHMDKKSLEGVAVIKIIIESWSAKQKSAPQDSPGAFNFNQEPG
jgi:nitroimidazol reductase NimA-like FMN-containing flavoprotein (pyridoxamine 5'-phosphate oxidase superfamily)